MVILNLKLDNIYGFKNFEINFSYPKRIVNSVIEDEHLAGHPNFRYKKAVVLMGANATGKTSLGKTLLGITNFLNAGDTSSLQSFMSRNPGAAFTVDFVNRGNALYRLSCTMKGCPSFEEDTLGEFSVKLYSAPIGLKDSYETAAEKLKLSEEKFFGNYSKLFKKIGKFDCIFSCPGIKPAVKISKADRQVVLKVLRAVIGTLDPTLTDIGISKDLRNSYIIRRGSEEIIIQDGKLLSRESLSSGTAEGVGIAFFLALLISGENGFYYCDEHFSYIQSDIEKRIFGIMLEHLGENEQLIFTTHNTDMLDLNLPKHCFAFLRKKKEEDYNVTVTYASEFLKRGTDSIRCAVENDVFSSLPDETLLNDLEKGFGHEK